MIYLICFGEISSDEEKSTPFMNYKIAKSLYVNKLLSKVICLQYDTNLDIPANYILSIKNNIPLRLLFKILSILDRIILPFNSRYYKEFIFDISDGHVVFTRTRGYDLSTLNPINIISLPEGGRFYY